jgi:hypothetical protein
MKIIKYIIIIFIISAIAGGAVLYIKQRYAVTPINLNNSVKPNIKIDDDSAANKPDVINLPTSLLLPVPFTPQAPTANWDELHNEACEEAVAIMAHEYFSGNTSATLQPSFVEKEISIITDWFTKRFGYYLDTTSNETAEMIRELYDLNTNLITNFSEDDIKEALAQNKLVLISFNGRLLGNPNYKSPGPIHHMLLIKGYNKEGYVTNDPGTRNGQSYTYDFDTLFNAAADWDHSIKNVDVNKKIAIIVSAK